MKDVSLIRSCRTLVLAASAVLIVLADAAAQDGVPLESDYRFALAMVYGLRADSAALIEGHNMAFLSNARKAANLAQTLLTVAPDYADAHPAPGVAQYVIGSLIAPVR